MMERRNVSQPTYMDRDESKARIRDVAERARVSVATASRSLNNLSSVDVRLANRVIEAANELNYHPNPHAKALVRGSSELLGLLVSEGLGSLLTSLVSTFERLAARSGHCVLIGFVDGGAHRLNQCVVRMLAQNVGGIAVILPPEHEVQPGSPLHTFGRTPMVSLDQGPAGQMSTVLRVSYQSGMREAIRHLASLGHRNIALINGRCHKRFSLELLAAFQISMSQIGLPCGPLAVVEADLTAEAGAEAIRELMGRQFPPTAVITSNGVMAVGAMSGARDLALSVPQDLSIVAFGGMNGDFLDSAIVTSVELSGRDIARAALGALGIGTATATATSEYPSLSSVEILTRLVVRRSTDFATDATGAKPCALEARAVTKG
jgi:DNA-binding LacI/PurR family transcriptional regulator